MYETTQADRLKTQTDITATSLYELLAIATKNREPLFTLRSIIEAMGAVEQVKECCQIKEHRAAMGLNVIPNY